MLEGKDRHIQTQATRIQHLEEQLALLKRHIFGARSEKLVHPDAVGEDLFGDAPSSETETIPSHVVPEHIRVRRSHGRAPIPDDLERRVTVLDIPEEAKVCPCCGGLKRCIGEDSSEVLGLDVP